MAITLHFSEKSGTKELAHDLHFQAPKYETTHVVVPLELVDSPTDLFRTSQNLHLDFLNFSLNQERHQDTLLQLQHPLFHPRQPPPPLLHPPKKARNVN